MQTANFIPPFTFGSKSSQDKNPILSLNCINKKFYLLKHSFLKGSILGFSFWYTAYVNSLKTHKFLIAPHSVRPLFFPKKFLNIPFDMS